MIIEPKVRGFICTTAHPAGCAQNVKNQIEYVKGKGTFQGPKKVLVLGASTGYGLSSRIAAAFGSRAATIGVGFEKSASLPDGTIPLLLNRKPQRKGCMQKPLLVTLFPRKSRNKSLN